MSSRRSTQKGGKIAPKANVRQARFESQLAARKRKRLSILVGLPVVIAVIAVGVLIAVNGRADSGNAMPTIVAATAPDSSIPVDGLTIGSPDAPVKLTEYGDYQCPYCAQFAADGFPPLLNEYIASGKVQFTYVPMSFLGDESVRAVEAALCANDQGEFWTMHDTIYKNHSGENQGAFSDDRLRTMAELSGLEMTAFNSCMADNTHKDDVAAYAAQAQAAGVDSTPSLSLNGAKAISFTNWNALKEQIDALLPE